LADLRSILSDPQFPARVERLEAAAWLEVARLPGPGRQLESHTIDGTILIVDRSEEQPVSRAFLLGIDRPISQRLLTGIVDAYEVAGVESFSTCLLPTARPTHAPRLLEGAGFTRGPPQAAVVRPVGGLEGPDPFFRIRVATPEDRPTIQDLMGRTTGDPPDWISTFTTLISGPNWRTHLAFEGSTAYAMGGFFFSGDTALLFTRSWVLPGFETRGVQAALIQAAVRDAESRGCRWVVSLYPVTAETRVRRFQRMGFEVIFQRRVYFYGKEPGPDELANPLSEGALR
jgi:GNAT superfamily N-acetyltransferase